MLDLPPLLFLQTDEAASVQEVYSTPGSRFIYVQSLSRYSFLLSLSLSLSLCLCFGLCAFSSSKLRLDHLRCTQIVKAVPVVAFAWAQCSSALRCQQPIVP